MSESATNRPASEPTAGRKTCGLAALDAALRARTVGAHLASARTRAGLTSVQAMRALRKRLRQAVNRWGSAMVAGWESGEVELDPWLLVEYLVAVRAPLATWLDVLEPLLIADGSSASGIAGRDFRSFLTRASAEQRAAALAVLRDWVRSEAEMARLPTQVKAVEERVADLLETEPAARRASDAVEVANV